MATGLSVCFSCPLLSSFVNPIVVTPASPPTRRNPVEALVVGVAPVVGKLELCVLGPLCVWFFVSSGRVRHSGCALKISDCTHSQMPKTAIDTTIAMTIRLLSIVGFLSGKHSVPAYCLSPLPTRLINGHRAGACRGNCPGPE